MNVGLWEHLLPSWNHQAGLPCDRLHRREIPTFQGEITQHFQVNSSIILHLTGYPGNELLQAEENTPKFLYGSFSSPFEGEGEAVVPVPVLRTAVSPCIAALAAPQARP